MHYHDAMMKQLHERIDQLEERVRDIEGVERWSKLEQHQKHFHNSEEGLFREANMLSPEEGNCHK